MKRAKALQQLFVLKLNAYLAKKRLSGHVTHIDNKLVREFKVVDIIRIIFVGSCQITLFPGNTFPVYIYSEYFDDVNVAKKYFPGIYSEKCKIKKSEIQNILSHPLYITDT